MNTFMNKYKFWDEYKNVFEEKDIRFLNKYYSTKSLKRLKSISQFCGCDYTNLYSPLFYYSRFAHSEIVAFMTYHFTKNKKDTIIALLHDIGTPCFAHVVDFALGDSKNQETSEKSIKDVILSDEELQRYLEFDGISIEDFDNLSHYPVLENKTPRLCTDRLDGVLGTCYIWLHTHSIKDIYDVYNDMCVLSDEKNNPEIGFKSVDMAIKFSKMVYTYATELQGNRDKFVMQYIADVIKKGIDENIFTLNDLYKLKESEIINIIKSNFESWNNFEGIKKVVSTNYKPKDYYISVDSKKRNVIPLVFNNNKNSRIDQISNKAIGIYNRIDNFEDKKYAYVKTIKKI